MHFRKFLELAWNALQKATGDRILLWCPCVFLHMNIHHSDSSFDKAKCDERLGCKDSTFSSLEKQPKYNEGHWLWLKWGWEGKENTQMWKWSVCSAGWSNTCLRSQEWTNKKRWFESSWNWWIWNCATWFLYHHDILSLAECNWVNLSSWHL